MSERKYSPEDVLKILRACTAYEKPIRERCAECPAHHGNCTDFSNEVTAADAIEELLAQLRWIPVTERLPVVGEDALTMSDIPCVEVLVVIEGCTTATTLYCDGEDFFDVQDIQGDEIIPYRVMYWRPMPEVPGEEVQDEAD